MLVRSPTFTNRLSSVMLTGSRPDSRIAGPRLGRRSRGASPLTAVAIASMCAGVVPQQPPTMLTSPLRGELAERRGHLVGGLVVLAERVGQAGVGVHGDEGVGEPAQLGDVGAQVGGAERAVQPDRERPDVAHGVPERLGHLAGQGASGGVGDGAGDDHRPAPAVLLEQRLEGEDRRLGVEGVEDRLDEQQVGAAVDQAAGLLEVRRDELVVGDVAGARVVDVGRDRRGAVGRAEGAGDEPRVVGAWRPRRRASRASSAPARLIS